MRLLRSHLVWLLIGAAALTVHSRAAQAGDDVVLRAAAASVTHGAWQVVADASAAGGLRMANLDAGASKLPSASASPLHYFELTFTAEGGIPYHLWLRGRAQDDSYENDSVYVQFSGSITPEGMPTWRIGTSSATSVVLEDCSGCGVSGWGWQDNHYGGLANPIYFASTGPQTIRVQVREDGLSIDQIVLSPSRYLTSAPGPPRGDATILDGEPAPPPAPGVVPVRGPYLQQVGERTAVVVWATREPGPAAVRAGDRTYAAATTFFGSDVTGVENFYQHEAELGGLTPATSYGYQLFVGGIAASTGSDVLRTAPPTGTGAVRFIAFGDSGTGSAEQRALASRMNADTFDFAVHGGDIVYGDSGGTGAASVATYQSWFFDVYASWLRQRPFFPSMGNHDARAANDWGRAYLDLFSLPLHGALGPFVDHAERYYSFDYGPVHVVTLDTELAFADQARRMAQLQWLDADLSAASTQPWKIAVFHRSPYSAGAGHGSDLQVRQAFAPIFERHGVQLSLSAHEHGYERSVPWKEGLDAHQAVTYVVSGGGGAPLYPSGRDTWTAVSASVHHYVRVAIDGCLATVEAVVASGEVVDAWTLDGCAQRGDAAPPDVAFSGIASGMTVSGSLPIEAVANDDVRVEKVDLWVDGRIVDTDRDAPYRFQWNASAAGDGPHTLELRAHDIAGRHTAAAVSVVVAASGGEPGGLPAGWSAHDVGPVGAAGTTSYAGSVFTVDGAGADIWGTADAFRYTYHRLSGDGAITARVQSMHGTDPWMKAGVMIRAASDAHAAHASMFVSLARGVAFQRRITAGSSTVHTGGPLDPAPYWVRLTRHGHLITASASADGQTWSVVGVDWVVMSPEVLIGLAVTSHSAGTLASAVFDRVSLSGAQALPFPWQVQDIGFPATAGAASAAGGSFTIQGSGADIWGTADAFTYVYRAVSGDVTVTARVESLDAPHEWSKAGVMIRASLTRGSRHGMTIVTGARGLAFQRRLHDEGATTHTAGPGTAAPVWVRLQRRGSTVSAFVSGDGTTWTSVGAEQIDLPDTTYVGLAVTSHADGALATGSFSQIQVSP